MTNGNDMAFPLSDQSVGLCAAGLSKREYFAAMAMQGILSFGWNRNTNDQHRNIAHKAASIADDLIAELNKPQP